MQERESTRADQFMDGVVPYITKNYGHLFSPVEYAAWKHLSAIRKWTTGFTPEEAERELLKRRQVPSSPLSRDPAVLALAAKGMERLMEDVAQRILREHPDEVRLNRCPRCGGLTRTPKARLCLHCGHDWHQADED